MAAPPLSPDALDVCSLSSHQGDVAGSTAAFKYGKNTRASSTASGNWTYADIPKTLLIRPLLPRGSGVLIHLSISPGLGAP